MAHTSDDLEQGLMSTVLRTKEHCDLIVEDGQVYTVQWVRRICRLLKRPNTSELHNTIILTLKE